MSESGKKIYQIKNLSCANCAMKIENKIKGLDEVSSIHLDVVNQKLSITSSGDERELLKKMNEIADGIEPGTKFQQEKDHLEEGLSYKGKIFNIISGSIFFILAYIDVLPEDITTIFFITAYALIGYEVIYKAFRNIANRNYFDENLLMTIATLAAVYVKSYPEAVAVMLFYEVGELFQDLAVERSRKSIKNLIDIQPKFAHIKTGESVNTVNPDEVKINDIILVKPGEKIPLDGIILKGQSSVDTSSLTGESIPKQVSTDDEVLAGFVNYNGVLEIKVTKRYEDSAVSKILELVENAQSKKAKAEKFITKFARIYTPIVIVLAILTVFLPMLFVANYDFNDYLYRGAIFLVVSCPCALVISIPLSIFGGIGASSKQGILIKGGNYLDLVRRVDTVIFDKTGTLTKGNFIVSKVHCVNGKKDDMVNKTIMAESLSNHAIGKAIVEYKKIDFNQTKIEEFEEIFGHGIHAKVDGDDVLAGNTKLMILKGIAFTEVKVSGTIVYVAINQKYVGYFEITDEIKPEAVKTIKELKKLGVKKTIMLTGDNQLVAQAVGDKVNIDEVFSNLLPEDKLNRLEQIKAENPKKIILFVGDGVNDTPVLMAADIGVAMGALGSDAAIETSDIVIMNDDINKLPTAINIAKLTNQKVWQNITLALGIKFIVLGLSAFGLATMWGAVFADVGVTILAVLNSILILKFKNKELSKTIRS